jgi:hypothetical protein
MPVLTTPETRIFDVNDIEHRKLAFDFFNTNKWGNIKKFTVLPPFSNIVDMLRYELAQYYMEKEFKTVNKIFEVMP